MNQANEKIEFVSKLSKSDFRKFNFSHFYRSPIGIFLTIIGLGMWYVVLMYVFGKNEEAMEFPYLQFIFGLWMIFLMPISLIIGANRRFKSQERLHEEIKYSIDNECVEAKGESFEWKFTWDKVHKVMETKDLLLIYQSNKTANIISKKMMSQDNIQALKQMIINIPSLKYKFQK